MQIIIAVIINFKINKDYIHAIQMFLISNQDLMPTKMEKLRRKRASFPQDLIFHSKNP